jgi:hypothetical protein
MATLKNTIIDTTGALQLPVGTTAQRPTADAGHMRYNSTFKTVETYTGTRWEYMPDIVRTGLVLNLDAGEPSSYSGSGTTWTDLSGGGNNGTLVNGVGYTSSNGGALVFDGSNDYVTLSSSQIARGTGAFTWNFWAKLNDLTNFSILFSGAGSNTDYGVVYMNPSSSGLGYYALGNRISDNNTSFGSSWWFISFVGNGGANGSRNLKLYRNGSQAGSTYTFDYNFTATTPNIGANHSLYSELMRGNISNVTYYNRELSASEVQQNYNALRGRFI